MNLSRNGNGHPKGKGANPRLRTASHCDRVCLATCNGPAWILNAIVLAFGLLPGTPAWAQIVCGDVRLERIVVPQRSPEPVRFAAEELQAYLKRSLGADLPIERGGPVRGAFFITSARFTPGAEAKAGGFTQEPNRKFDRTVIAQREAGVYLIGENDRSALYAVYDFLQDRLRIRFYGPGPANEIVPVHKELRLEPGFTLRKGSALEYRQLCLRRS